MTPEQRDLARRLVEAEWWEWGAWTHGMLFWRGMSDDSGGIIARFSHGHTIPQLAQLNGAVPCLDDPATVGVLLGRLIESIDRFELFRDGNGIEISDPSASPPWGTDSDFDLGTAIAKALLAVKAPTQPEPGEVG